jgi:hypothetical protein
VEKPHGCGKEHARWLEFLRGNARVGRFRFDRLTEEARGKVECLVVAFKQVTLNFCPPLDAVYFWFHVLVLEPTGKGDEFRRIGEGKVWENSGVFDNVGQRYVEIV